MTNTTRLFIMQMDATTRLKVTGEGVSAGKALSREDKKVRPAAEKRLRHTEKRPEKVPFSAAFSAFKVAILRTLSIKHVKCQNQENVKSLRHSEKTGGLHFASKTIPEITKGTPPPKKSRGGV